MAKHNVECPQCEGSYVVQLVGRTKDLQWKLDNWDWTCDECREKFRKEENAKAAAANAESGLQSMTGTEKQIAWAETIRAAKIAAIDEIVDGYDAKMAEATKDPKESAYQNERSRERGFSSLADAFACAKEAAIQIINTTAASWWIDNREENLGRLILKHAEAVAKSRKNIPEAPDAKAEATVRPENPLTETVAEIRLKGDFLEVYFPEKRDDFWRLIKKILGFSWTGACWQRKLSVKTGLPLDRLADTGNSLLVAGFPIRIYDDAARGKAISGEFDPEVGRWIMARTSGDYRGWFSINWPKVDDFYSVAKKITGSRYDKPDVVVQAEHFEEVIDFAEVHGFELSPGAIELAAKAEEARAMALVAKPAAVNRQGKNKAADKPEPLPVPNIQEVDDELRDRD